LDYEYTLSVESQLLLVSRIQDEQERRHSPKTVPQAGNSYWLTRFVILRLLGLVYAVAFLVAAKQLVPLIGREWANAGQRISKLGPTQLGSRSAACCEWPTLFWFGISDDALSIFSWAGFALSLVVLGGYANAILLAVLWAMYIRSFHIRPDLVWLRWEIQLLETGFLSIFLCPLLDGRPFPKSRPPILVIWHFSVARFPHHVWRRPDQIARPTPVGAI